MSTGSFRQRVQLVESTIRLLDLLFLLVAFVIAHRVRIGSLEMTSERLLIVVSTLSCAYVVFSFSGLYRRWRGKSVWSEIGALAVALVVVLLILGLVLFVTKTGQEYSRVWIALSFSFGFALSAGARVVIRQIANWRRANGHNMRTMLLVGSGELADRVVERLGQNAWAGIEIIGRVCDPVSVAGGAVVPRLGDVEDVSDIVEARRRQGRPVDFVWFTLPASERNRTAAAIDALQDSTVGISIVPDFFDMQLLNARVDTFADIPLVNLSSTGITGASGVLKRVFDVVLASLIIAVTSPLLLFIALLVRTTSPGPAIFVQRRYGVDGREIAVWKFRTMSVQENGNTVTQAERGDARVTRVGAFLRRTSLDELPQFFNVLQGSMSIVGPRPHAVAHNEFYRKRIKGYMTRHVIRPGITGLAQVSGCRGQTETEDKMSRRIEHDLSYISRWSLGLDLKIIVLTLREVFFPRNVY